MTRQTLPIGIQTFREIREEGCYYVDKTAFALRLIEQGKYYFLSRPRRFGKSLFLDTLGELLAGNEALFHGLSIHDRWDWTQRHPVIRLSRGTTPPSAAIRKAIWTGSSPRNCRDWTAIRSVPGTTGTTGPVRRSITPSTYY